MVFEVGRVCMKVAGRDAGQYGVVVEQLDKSRVLIDGNTRRRACNVAHLIPTKNTLDIKAKATTGEVKEALGKLGLKVLPVTKPKQAPPAAKKVRAAKKTAPAQEA